MKKTREIVGLPIISISDGIEVGKVKAVVFNAEKGAIDFIVVDSGIQIVGTRIIPAGSVLGIGEYALTIEDSEKMVDISKVPAAIDLLQKDIQIKGTKVLTKKGRLVGQIGEVFVDEDNKCSITCLEFTAENSNTIRMLPRRNVITFGKNLIIVTDDFESVLSDSVQQVEEDTSFTGDDLEQPIISLPDSDIDTDTAPQPGVITDMMEMKHREYLRGKKASKTIYDNYGNVIIEENSIIDDTVFDIAKNNNKVIELVMNNK